MAEETFLNPYLYKALMEVFDGNVGVSCQGKLGGFEQVVPEGDHWKAVKARDGEVYHVNCPVCGDRRRRLYLSHWAFRKLEKDGKPIWTDNLVYCQNEHCRIGELKTRLRARVRELGGEVSEHELNEYLAKQRKKPKKIEGIPMPKGAVPIISDDAHPLCKKYLVERGFDLDELFQKYDVHAVTELEEYPVGGPKIIYPAYFNHDRVLWQARLTWDPTKEDQHKGIHKYHTVGHKSDYIYNRNMAMAHNVVVICEGVTDVHKIGDCAVALFGKKPSDRQVQIIRNSLGASMGILMLDRDAEEEAMEFYEKYRGKGILFDEGFYRVPLDEKDPGKMTRAEIWGLINATIAKELCK